MENIRLSFVCLVIAALVFLYQGCAHTGSYNQGIKLESTGNWEEALQAYLKDLKAKPNNTDTKIAVKRTIIKTN